MRLDNAIDNGLRTGQGLHFQELHIVKDLPWSCDLPMARVAAWLRVRRVDHGDDGGLDDQELLATSHILEMIDHVLHVDCPTQSRNFTEGCLDLVEVVVGRVEEEWAPELSLSIWSKCLVSDLDPRQACLPAIGQGAGHPDARVVYGFGVHAHRLHHAIGQEEGQQLVVHLDAQVEPAPWIEADKLEAGVEGVAVVTERIVESSFQDFLKFAMESLPVSESIKEANQISSNVNFGDHWMATVAMVEYP